MHPIPISLEPDEKEAFTKSTEISKAMIKGTK